MNKFSSWKLIFNFQVFPAQDRDRAIATSTLSIQAGTIKQIGGAN